MQPGLTGESIRLPPFQELVASLSQNSAPEVTLHKFDSLEFALRSAPECLIRQEGTKELEGFGVLVAPGHYFPKRGRPGFIARGCRFECDFCGVTKTPERRAGPNGKGTLCNRCGLRWARSKR